MSFLHRGNRYRLAMEFAIGGTLVLAILTRWAWYNSPHPVHWAPLKSQMDPPRGQSSPRPRHQFIVATFILGATLARPLAAQQASRLPTGTYVMEMRDSTAENPYAGILFHFGTGGELMWERDTQAIQLMRWSLTGDTLTLQQSDDCVLNPVGVYQVESRPDGGYALLVLEDGCDPRAQAVSSTYLRPALE